MSQLSDLMAENSISPDKLVSISAQLEKPGIEARQTLVQREALRRKNKAGDEKKTYEETNLGKPAVMGRGVSMGTLQRAMAGTPVRRLVRKKIVRAVNAALVSAKKEPVEWRAVFADVPARKAKKK